MSEKKLAIEYIRVSTKGQVEECTSLEAQEKAIKQYCELNKITIGSPKIEK